MIGLHGLSIRGVYRFGVSHLACPLVSILYSMRTITKRFSKSPSTKRHAMRFSLKTFLSVVSKATGIDYPRVSNLRFSLKTFLSVVSLAALAMFVWVRYLNVEEHSMRAAVYRHNWEMLNTDPDRLAEMMQFQLPPEERKSAAQMGVFFADLGGGVGIKPAFHSFWFKTKATYWNREEKMELLHRKMTAFLESSPELEVERVEVEEYSLEYSSENQTRERVYWRRTFDTYPPENSS